MSILHLIQAEWPQSFRKMTVAQANTKVELWTEMFRDDDRKLVDAAVKALIVSGNYKFAPGIGEIKAKMRQIQHPDETTELDAWNIVLRALPNCGYEAESEFAKMPPVIQRLVQSPSQLREWSLMDSATVHSVVASNFQRSFRTVAARTREFAALPPDVQNLAKQIAASKTSPEYLPQGGIS